MNLERKKKYSLVCISAIIPALLIISSASYASKSEKSDDEGGNTIRTVGGEQVRFNKAITSNFRFSPNHPVHVKQGDTITLEETSGDGSVKTAGDSVLLLPGQTFTLTVTAPAGTHIHFMCIFHPWMQGELVVDEAGD